MNSIGFSNLSMMVKALFRGLYATVFPQRKFRAELVYVEGEFDRRVASLVSRLNSAESKDEAALIRDALAQQRAELERVRWIKGGYLRCRQSRRW